MTDQNNTTTVETSQTNSEATLEQWHHLPIYMTKDRVKPLQYCATATQPCDWAGPSWITFCRHSIHPRATLKTEFRRQ